MLEILVNDQQLTIPIDTTIVLEQHNSVFDLENIMSDVIWTFDVPSKPNATILDNANYIEVVNTKRYDCSVRFQGISIAKGYLYLQRANEKTFSCGVVLNAFNPGFGEVLLKDDPWPSDIEIGSSQSTHRQDWLNFLKQSLKKESIIKFFLCYAEEFYSNNKDYGKHIGLESTLENIPMGKDFKYINRLFTDRDGNILNLDDTSTQGVRIFNTANQLSSIINGYTFAPAIKLEWLITQVMKAGGMNVIGNFVHDPRIQRLFVQSMNALDGDISQYQLQQYVHLNGLIEYSNDPTSLQHPINIESDDGVFNSFTVHPLSFPSVGFRLLLSTDDLFSDDVDLSQGMWPDNPFNCQLFKHYDEAYFLAIRADGQPLPTYRSFKENVDGNPYFIYGELPTAQELISAGEINFTPDSFDCVLLADGGCIWYLKRPITGNKPVKFPMLVKRNNATLIQLTDSLANDVTYINEELGTYTEGTYPCYDLQYLNPYQKLHIQLVKCKIYTFDNETLGTGQLMIDGFDNPGRLAPAYYGGLEAMRDYEVIDTSTIDYTDTPLNIFSKVLKWSEHVPNITNKDFIANLCKFFGLSFYYNSMTKEAQLSFFKDTIKAKSIDLTPWLIDERKNTFEPKNYECSMQTCLGVVKVSDNYKLKSVATKYTLPLARSYKNKSVFVKNENCYNKSIKDENSSRWQWQRNSGNDNTLQCGDATKQPTKINPGIKIPNMRWCDKKGYPKFICEVATAGCSSLLDETYEGKFDFILQQYHGKRLLKLQDAGDVTEAMIEVANPTIYAENGNKRKSLLNLTATGEQSVGELFQKPLYDYLANQEKYTFTYLVPACQFLNILNLLQPQNKSPQEQVRYIYNKNRKYLPTKITYEFSSSELVKVIIDCSRKHTEI